MRAILICSIFVSGFSFFATSAEAQSYRLLFETDADSTSPTELIMVNFNTYGNLIGGITSGQDNLNINVTPTYSVANVMNDSGTYRMLFETDDDSGSPTELINVNFNTYADMISGTSAGQENLGINVTPSYSVAGLINDAGMYRMLFETDVDSGSPTELIMVNFNSYADLLAGNSAGQDNLGINVTPSYSVAGLVNDGGTYRMLFETDADSGSPTELIMVNFNSYGDMVNGTSAGQDNLDINVTPSYSVAGMILEAEPVPEPATLAVLGLGVAALRRRKNRRSCLRAAR